MESFDLFFSLKLAYLVFTPAELTDFHKPSGKYTTVAEGTKCAHILRSHYNSLRTEAAFDRFYHDVMKTSEGLTDEPALPCYRKVPRRYDESTNPYHYTSSKERYQQAYSIGLDHAGGEIDKRFHQSDLFCYSGGGIIAD